MTLESPPGVRRGARSALAPAGAVLPDSRSWALAVAVCLALAVAHAVLVWGHVNQFWGDTGRWMHEVDRFANGERLYVDFTWPFPPLAMWLLGTAARFIGTGVHQLWALTCAVYFGLVVLLLRYIRAVVPPDLVLATSVAALVGAMAYAQYGGAPLPLGMYSPAAPVGGVFLLVSVVCLVAVVRGDERLGTSAMLGMAASLAALTKQDFWAPALVTALFGIRWAPARLRRVVVATTVLPALLGYGAVAAALGPADFLAMLGGFGHAAEFGGMGLPSGRRLAAEAGALSLWLWAGLLLARRPPGRWWLLAGALSVGAVLAYLAAGGLHGLRVLQQDVYRRGLPLVLPMVALGWLWAGRRTVDRQHGRLAAILLVVCIAARARRGFQGLEWYHVMLELPAYALLLRTMLGDQQVRWQRVAAGVMVALAGFMYWERGRGPLTASGREPVESVETVRGRIFLSPNQAGDYRFAAAAVRALDPGGRRPLFAFGYSGGWNYFLGRPNPTGAPQGFRFTREPAETLLARAVAATPMVFDVRLFTTITVRDDRAGVVRWDAPEIASHYLSFDRPYFERLIAGCRWVSRHPDVERPFMVVYDCGG